MNLASIPICDRWELSLLPGSGGHYEYLHTVSSKNPACFLSLLSGLPQGLSVCEHFGGVGIFTKIIQEVLHPRSHVISELDGECVAQLLSAFGGDPGVTISQGDAHETMATTTADLVVCDFPYATIKHHEDWPWDTLFGHKPKYVIWADTAARRIGLHRGLYSKFFGTTVNYHRDYVVAYSKYMWDRYGYSVTAEAHYIYSYMLAQPVDFTEDFPFTKVVP